jgi:hypothetical protein
MTDLNEYECEMLDALLEAFGIPDSLTRDHVLELFDGDEALAFAMVQVLTREALIGTTGAHGQYDLPERLVLKPKGEKLLREGGFVRRYQQEQQKPVEVGGTLAKLQQQNMRLQNEKLAHGVTLSNLQKKIDRLKVLQYVWIALIIIALVAGYFVGHSFGAHTVKHPKKASVSG